MVRYEAASERKSKIMDIIRSLDLPNNPLDDIIDQVIMVVMLSSLMHELLECSLDFTDLPSC